MKFSSVLFVAVQALLVSANPVAQSGEDADIEVLAHKLVIDRLGVSLPVRETSPLLQKRACKYPDGCEGANGCLSKYGPCKTCSGAGDHPGACTSCWIWCSSTCGC